LRYFNVFGPGQHPQGEYAAVIPRFISAVLRGQPPIVYGDGEQSRDFLYISNVVDATLRAAMAPGAVGKVINVGSGEKVTLNQLLAHLSQMVGRPLEPVYQSVRPGDVRESLADISLLRSVLEYEPLCSFARGLELTFRAFEAASLATQQPLTRSQRDACS
jgi:UDP-glucose 4-epimerase